MSKAESGRTQSTSYAEKARLTAAPGKNPPAVILVEPQLGENMGTAARAMMNTGLEDLRLVDPKNDWTGERAIAAASGADRILKAAKRFDTVRDAIADLEVVYAATARQRDMVKPLMNGHAAAADMRTHAAANRKMGILFGRERDGLANDEISFANTIIEVPLNPEHSSLNLAQAVLIIGYEWFQAGYDGPDALVTHNKIQRPAGQKLLQDLFDHLERELINCGFLRIEEKRPSMMVNIRNMLQRADLTEQEVRTLHGVITELRYGRRDDRPKRQMGHLNNES
jgi:tRNA/rRNA methyltransferase